MKNETKRSGMDILPPRTAQRLHWIISLVVVLACAISAQAQNLGYIYTANETLNVVDVMRASDHVVIASMPTISTPYGIAASQDGKRIYTSTYDGKNIYAFDGETNTLVSTLQFGSELREITLTPNDKYLYVPDYYENVVHIVAAKDNTLMGDIPVGAAPHMVAFGDGGKYAYVTAEAGQEVTVIDTKTATVVSHIPIASPVGIAASPDGKMIYVSSNGYEVAFISVKSQAVVANVSVPGNGRAVAVSPDGKWLYAVCANPSKGYVISVENQTVVADFSIGTNPRNVIVSPDGKAIYVTNFDSHNLYAISAETYKVDYVKALGALDGIAFSATAKPLIENYRFKTIDYPGGIQTEVRQVNDDGYAVGAYFDQAHVEHGFLYREGEFVNYDFPGATSTQLNSINSSNVAVGSIVDSQGYTNGIELFDGAAGIINLNIEQNGQSTTWPSATAGGIDDEGTVVGEYYPPPNYANVSYRLDGFTQQNFIFPDVNYVSLEGVAESLAVGWVIDSANNIRGLRWKGDEYSQFDFPGGGIDPNGSAGFTFAYKVNRRRDIVGTWGNGSGSHGYLIDGRSQREVSFDFPGATSTSNRGINNRGQITGSYLDENYVMHGFIATPMPDECDHKQ